MILHSKYWLLFSPLLLLLIEHLQDKLVSTTASPTNNPSAVGNIVGKSLNVDPKDSDNEIGGDDGCASCYSSSMRDLLSDELPEDCTFNGPEDIQVFIKFIKTKYYSIVFEI